MPAARLAFEIFNGREEVLSSDLVRAQILASREFQDFVADVTRTDDLRDPGTGAAITPASAAAVGSPRPWCRMLATLTPAGGFNMTLSPGEAFGVDPSITDPDSSPYPVTRWVQQTLTFANPDGANPRIDLVVAMPAEVGTDPASRNVLLDPVSRTVGASIVNKTNEPRATISVVTGTPGASPTPPAVPAGAVPIFEVVVLQGAPDSSSFTPIRRTWRRVEGPLATAHAVMQGLQLRWSVENDETTDSVLSIDPTVPSRLLIDGELITFCGAQGAIPDTANSPFAVAAGASDLPFFIYAVGGRNLPQGDLGGCPFALIESLTPPDPFGRPSAPIQTPRGPTRNAALYVGVGYVIAATTRRKCCLIEGDWIYARRGSVQIETTARVACFTEQMSSFALDPAATTLINLHSVPVTARAMRLGLFLGATAPSNSQVSFGVADAGGGQVEAALAHLSRNADSGSVYTEIQVATPPGGQFAVGSGLATLRLKVLPRAYSMSVPRLSV